MHKSHNKSIFNAQRQSINIQWIALIDGREEIEGRQEIEGDDLIEVAKHGKLSI